MRATTHINKMRVSAWSVQFVLLVQLLRVVYCEKSEIVTSATGESGFEEALKQAPLVMVKFFHPLCPHCQAIKRMYEELAKSFKGESATITFIQVDVSNDANAQLTRQHSEDGVPTLKLYKRNHLLSAYDGSRDKHSMTIWLQQHIQLYKSPIIHQIIDNASFKKFLSQAADNPVVLTLSPSPPHSDSDARFEKFAALSRDSPGPTIFFAHVPHPSLLIPDKKRYQVFSNSFSATPYAAAVRNASQFNSHVQWWVPGIIGGEPLTAFIAATTLPRDGNGILTEFNAPALSASTRSLLYVFGSALAPSFSTRKVMRKLANLGGDDLLVVYANDKQFKVLKKHVDNVDTKIDGNDNSETTRYVLYRSGNRMSERRVYRGVKKDGDIEQWLGKYLAEHGQFPLTHGLAGVVNDMSNRQLAQTFQHDGRIVLLLVCGKYCDTERDVVKDTARMLKADARAVVVAEYAGDEVLSINGQHPDWKRPYVALVLPGSKPLQVNPHRALQETRNAVASISQDHDDVLMNETRGFGDVTINHIGFMLTVLGIALTIQNHVLLRRKRGGFRGQVNVETAKSV